MDKETTVQTKFHDFLKQRNSKTNVAMQKAQKLVNLYRVLNDFGPDFVTEYNVMLKECSEEVQTALQALVGGPEVRQYLEFLKSEDQKQEDTENSASNSQQAGWLPSPAEEQKGMETNGEISSDMWSNFVKEQDAKITKMMDEFRQEQNETLTRLMNQVASSLQAKKDGSAPAVPKTEKPEYLEIIEEKK
ncbi:MAG: hypothetical protein II938_00755 [Alphaproteobacteria bacterium]|nr:hypothetical protein [Alphaproteobacteria bacterium]